MAARLQLLLPFISTAGARVLLALPFAILAAFFWAVSLGGLAALADGEWLPGSGTSLTVALALAALLSCAALAIVQMRTCFEAVEPSRSSAPLTQPGVNGAPDAVLPTADESLSQ